LVRDLENVVSQARSTRGKANSFGPKLEARYIRPFRRIRKAEELAGEKAGYLPA
jgi:hypothetical protein